MCNSTYFGKAGIVGPKVTLGRCDISKEQRNNVKSLGKPAKQRVEDSVFQLTVSSPLRVLAIIYNWIKRFLRGTKTRLSSEIWASFLAWIARMEKCFKLGRAESRVNFGSEFWLQMTGWREFSVVKAGLRQRLRLTFLQETGVHLTQWELSTPWGLPLCSSRCASYCVVVFMRCFSSFSPSRPFYIHFFFNSHGRGITPLRES